MQAQTFALDPPVILMLFVEQHWLIAQKGEIEKSQDYAFEFA